MGPPSKVVMLDKDAGAIRPANQVPMQTALGRFISKQRFRCKLHRPAFYSEKNIESRS